LAAGAATAYARTLYIAPDLDRAAARDLAAQAAAVHQAAGPRAAQATITVRAWALYFPGKLGDSTAQANALGEDLLTDTERTRGPNHPRTLASRSNLATAYTT
jgi:hypothetical protein